MWTVSAAAWPWRFAELARLPCDLAWGRIWLQIGLVRSLLQRLQQPEAAAVDVLMTSSAENLGQGLALPFDLLRMQHAAGVLAGTRPRSLLESARFERQLGALERLTLGPLARVS
jgi:hypothetical protein